MSFAQFLRQQRSCRVRRSGDRGPVRSAMWQRRPDPALLRDCWCAVRAVHPTRSRGHKGHGPWMSAACLCDCMFSQRSRRRAGRSGSGTVQDVWIRQAVAALTGRPAGEDGRERGDRSWPGGRTSRPRPGRCSRAPAPRRRPPVHSREAGTPRRGKPGRPVPDVMFVRCRFSQTLARGPGSGCRPVQAAGEASTAALIRSRVVRSPSASSRSWPAAPPITGPSSVVPAVNAGRSRRAVSRRARDPVPVSS